MARAPRLLIATSVASTLTAFLLPYAARYRAMGWRVDAACNGGPEDHEVVGAFDRVVHLPWTRRPLDAANLLRTPPRLRALVQEVDYDLVHLHDPIAAFVGRYALRGLRARGRPKVVYTAHGFHFFKGASPARYLVFRSIETIASRWADRLILINREDEEAAKRFPIQNDRVRYMPGIGVDMTLYDPDSVSPADVAQARASLDLEPRQVMVLMVAEFNPGKRHLDAVSALAAADRPDLVLVCAGVGPMMEQVRAHAEKLGVADRVKLLGFRRDIPVLLRASAGLMLPSEREGLPRCIMEAGCLERPVIATRIRGVVELVSEDTGFLTDVGDVAAMAQALRRLTDDPVGTAALGLAGRRAMRQFDVRAVLEQHDALYQELLVESGVLPPDTRVPLAKSATSAIP